MIKLANPSQNKGLSKIALALISATVLCLQSCGGGSSDSPATGGDTTAPVSTITFPTATSLTGGKTVTVRGKATDPSGVADIRVNGLNASTSDDFANWSINVPLTSGINALSVTTIDNIGNRNDVPSQITINSNPLLNFPINLVLDSANNRALVMNRSAMLAVDLTTGLRTIVSNDKYPGCGECLSCANWVGTGQCK